MKRYTSWISTGAGFLLTAVFLVLALRNVRLAELWQVLVGAQWGWVLVMTAIVFADLMIRSARWQLLLSRAQGAKPPVFLLFRLEAIGLAMNNVLFMRIGELARAFLAGRELRLPLATALASVAVERALDVAALLTLFCAAAAGLPDLVPLQVLRGAVAVLAASLAAIGALAFAEERLEPGHSWERALRGWPKIHKLLSQLAAGASVLRRPKPAAQAVFLSLLLWGIDAGAYWAGARALGLGQFVDYPRAILILSWAGAAAALPAVPGGFGTFEAMVKSIMVNLGATAQQALGFAVFNHMVGYVVVTLIGLVFLSRIGLSLGELKAALEREKPR
jgi:hypothetical protein